MDNFYLVLIDYVRTILFHPILKGIELSILILLWQLIGGFVLFGLTYLLKPIDKMFNVNTRYLVLSFGLLLGFFLPIFIATNDWNDDKICYHCFPTCFSVCCKTRNGICDFNTCNFNLRCRYHRSYLLNYSGNFQLCHWNYTSLSRICSSYTYLVHWGFLIVSWCGCRTSLI